MALSQICLLGIDQRLIRAMELYLVRACNEFRSFLKLIYMWLHMFML